MGAFGAGFVFPEVNVAGGIVAIEAEIEFEGAFAAEGEVETVDAVLGVPVERDRGAALREAVAFADADGAQFDDLGAGGGSDHSVKVVSEAARRGAEVPHAIVVTPNPKCAVEAGGQFG